ncbi:hypothetical protein ACFL96_09830 [Thermoproteota archaeon]
MITFLNTAPSNLIDLNPLYIILILSGYSCTLIAGAHILSYGEDDNGDLLAKVGWVLLGTGLIIEIDRLIWFSQEEVLGNIFHTTTFLPWIFLTAYFHSRKLGLFAKRISIALAVWGLLFSVFMVFSGSTKSLYLVSSNIAFIFILIALPFILPVIRIRGVKRVTPIRISIATIWILLTGLGGYLFLARILIYLGLVSGVNIYTTFFNFFIQVGFLGSVVILVNNAVKSIKNKALAVIGITIIVILPQSIGLLNSSYMTLLIISLVSAALLSAIYALIQKRLKLISILGFIVFATLSGIHLGEYISIDTFEVSLNSGNLKNINGITIDYLGHNVIEIYDVVKIPGREIELPIQAKLLIELDLSVDNFERRIKIPVIYNFLDEVSGRSPLHSDIIMIRYGLDDLYISIEPNEEMIIWFKSAYGKAILGDSFDMSLNNVNISIKHTFLTTFLLLGLAALIIIGAYQLSYSTQSETIMPQASSKD